MSTSLLNFVEYQIYCLILANGVTASGGVVTLSVDVTLEHF